MRFLPQGIAAVAIAAIFYTLRPQPERLPPPLPTCSDAEIAAAYDALPEYQASDTGDFVRVDGHQLLLGAAPYFVRGVNYYPAHYPWRRFLTETDMATVERELDLLQAAGLNSLRIFLWNEALFDCPGSGAVPNVAAFLRLDGIIQRAAEAGFRLIVTLNDLPDLTDYPIYDNPAHVLGQTVFIVQRYRDETAILAWDLRNEGDIDYGTHQSIPGHFEREAVLRWLHETSTLVRSLDRQHLITAGWLYDNAATAPYVDFISLHHWIGASEVQQRIFDLQATTDKPVLLQEFGYSTQRMDPDSQARTIREVIDVVELSGAAGWLIWTAFDFPTDASCWPSDCLSPDNAEHYFGLWTSDYQPKPAVSVLNP